MTAETCSLPHHPCHLFFYQGELNAESGTLESPNFPEDYQPSKECVWKIKLVSILLIWRGRGQWTINYTGNQSFITKLVGSKPLFILLNFTKMVISCGNMNCSDIQSFKFFIL